MAELEEKLNAILGDPAAMGQIMSIAKALTAGENAPAGTGAPEGYVPTEGEQPPESAPAPSAQQATKEHAGEPPDWSAVTALLSSLSGDQNAQSDLPTSDLLKTLGTLDPKLVQTAIALFSEYSATDDRKVALLTALKPFLREERYAKMDRAIQIARLARVIRVAFQLFKPEGGQRDV